MSIISQTAVISHHNRLSVEQEESERGNLIKKDSNLKLHEIEIKN